MESKKWYEHDSNNTGFYKCLEPFENVFVGECPTKGSTKEWADQFDAIINVSCTSGVMFEYSKPNQATYWIPTNECGEWPYSSLAQFFHLMDYYYDNKKVVYVHCQAGAYRSPSMVYLWLKYKGYRDLHAYQIAYGKILGTDDLNKKEMMKYRLIKVYKNNLPPNYDVFAERLATTKNFMISLLSPKPVSSSKQAYTRTLLETIERSWQRFIWKIKSFISYIKFDILGDYRTEQITNNMSKTFKKYDKILRNEKSFSRYLEGEIRHNEFIKKQGILKNEHN